MNPDKMKLCRATLREEKRPVNTPSSWAMEQRKVLLSKNNDAETHINSLLTVSGFVFTREYIACTRDGEFFIDFVVDVNDTLVALEIDGYQHLWDQKYDRIRERLIMQEGEAFSFLRIDADTAEAIQLDELKRLLGLSAQIANGVTIIYDGLEYKGEDYGPILELPRK